MRLHGCILIRFPDAQIQIMIFLVVTVNCLEFKTKLRFSFCFQLLFSFNRINKQLTLTYFCMVSVRSGAEMISQ